MSGECDSCGEHALECQCNVCDMIKHTTWVSVKDMLPSSYFFVLVYSKMEGTNEPCPMTIARYNGNKWETLCNEEENNACASGDLFWSTDSEEITHWMPLPLPPKDE